MPFTAGVNFGNPNNVTRVSVSCGLDGFTPFIESAQDDGIRALSAIEFTNLTQAYNNDFGDRRFYQYLLFKSLSGKNN